MKKLLKCEICSGKRFKFLFKQTDKNFDIPGEFSLYKCEDCGIIFINPQPTGKELQSYYPKETYYSFNKVVTKEESRKEKLKIFLYDLYFNPGNKKYLQKIFFSPILPYLRGTSIMPGKKLLDFGCGSGQFLYEMAELGMKPHGVDPGDIDRENLRKFNIKNNLKEAKYPKEHFDLITMNQVLPHLNNPSRTLYELNRVLKKKGIFILGIPNSRSLAQRFFKKDWYQLDVPRHLFNFSDKILIRLLRKNGFKIIKIRFSSRTDQFVNSFYYKMNFKKGGKIYGLLKVLSIPLVMAVNLLKTGDQIEIWCSK